MKRFVPHCTRYYAERRGYDTKSYNTLTKWRRPARSTGTCSVRFATHIVTASTTLVLTVLAVVTRHTACRKKEEEENNRKKGKIRKDDY